MSISKDKLVEARDAFFACANNFVTAPEEIAAYKAIYEGVLSEIKNSTDLSENKKDDLKRFIILTVPDQEFERAAQYLFTHMKPKVLREIYYDTHILKESYDGSDYVVVHATEFWRALKKDGISWQEMYVERALPELLAEASRRFVETERRNGGPKVKKGLLSRLRRLFLMIWK